MQQDKLRQINVAVLLKIKVKKSVWNFDIQTDFLVRCLFHFLARQQEKLEMIKLMIK